MDVRTRTTVINLMDGRVRAYALPADRAVVAAFEEHDKGNPEPSHHTDPHLHPHFREHQLGFACGDWVAYKPDKRVWQSGGQAG